METCMLREETEFGERPKDGYGYIYIYYYNERMLYVGQTRQSVEERYKQHYKHYTNTAGAKITNRIVWFCIKEECLDYMEGILFKSFDGICQTYAPKPENCKIKQQYKDQCNILLDAINNFKKIRSDPWVFIMQKNITIDNIDHMDVDEYIENLFLLYDIQDIIFKKIKKDEDEYCDISCLAYQNENHWHQGFIYNGLKSHVQCSVLDMRYTAGVYDDVARLMKDHCVTPLYCVISLYEYLSNKTKYEQLMSGATNGLIIYDTTNNQWKYVFYHKNYNGVESEEYENYNVLLKDSIQTCINHYKKNYLHYIRWNGWGCMNIG